MHRSLRSPLRQRWLTAQDVAPTPSHVSAGDAAPAAAEVAATTMIAIPASVSVGDAEQRVRTPISVRVAAWPARRIVVISALMLTFGMGGVVFLSGRTAALSSPERAVPVAGSALTIDKPAGWTEGPVESAPALLESLVVGGSTRRPPGLYLTASGGRAMFVVHVANSAQLISVPAVPDVIGTAQVDRQWEFPTDLGPARRLHASGLEPGEDGVGFELDATYVISGGQIYLVGVFAAGDLSQADVSDYEAVLSSMRLPSA